MIFMSKLVSIITPCYNGGRYVKRFLESVLHQTYDNIELIIINDGSTDNTEDIILSYINRFEEKGFRLIYRFQENSGQSEAINNALQIFTGEYLIWADSDDELTPESTQKKVDYLEQHPEKGYVFGATKVVDEDTKDLLGYQRRQLPEKNELWLDLIKDSAFYHPGSGMVRTSCFREVMPNPLRIEAPREVGQNYQLLIPVIYHYPYGVIDDICYIYYFIRNSHSHINSTFEQSIHKIEVSQYVLNSILNRLNPKQCDVDTIKTAILRRKILSYLNSLDIYNRKDGISDIKLEFESLHIKDKYIERKILYVKYPILKQIFNFIHKLKALLWK